MKIRILQGDITTLDVDAIVNAANELMLGGGGVDGAIHQAAGEDLLFACKAIAEISPGVRCPVGSCQLTPGFDLPARFVIHTVGPVWRGGMARERELLEQCYRNSLLMAFENELSSIAFPSISCGAFGYPIDQAAEIAIRVIHETLDSQKATMEVTLVAFDRHMFSTLQLALETNT